MNDLIDLFNIAHYNYSDNQITRLLEKLTDEEDQERYILEGSHYTVEGAVNDLRALQKLIYTDEKTDHERKVQAEDIFRTIPEDKNLRSMVKNMFYRQSDLKRPEYNFSNKK